MNILRRERRKRERIPVAILFVGTLCLFYPIINYLQFVYYFELNVKEFSLLMGRLNLIQKILLVFPVFSGIGLLTVRSWGILLFCTNALLLIIFNMYAIVNYPIQKNWMSLVEVILVTTFSLYILRKDIYIPFGKFSKRGFRYAKRKIIPRKLEIVSKDKKWELETLDLSQRGFRVKIPNCSLGKNSEVLVRIEMNNRKYEVKAGVVRIANPIVGIAFREMPKELRNLLNKELRK